jgi:hypothetical protein
MTQNLCIIKSVDSNFSEDCKWSKTQVYLEKNKNFKNDIFILENSPILQLLMKNFDWIDL